MFDKFSAASSVSLLVVGDIILDEYIEGEINRMSAEAPIPVVDQTGKRHVLGGSANVAANIHSLGGNAHLVGVIGDDDSGNQVSQLLKKSGISIDNLVIDTTRPTTTKTRVTVLNEQKLRIDREKTEDISLLIEDQILHQVRTLIASCSGIILQDYNKGVLTPRLIMEIMTLANAQGKPTFVDPKFKNFWAYNGATIFKPNKKEITDAHPDKALSLVKMLRSVSSMLSCEAVICTLAEDGVALLHDQDFHHETTETIEVVDVSGAGDSTIAMISLAYLLGYSIKDLPRLCNLAGRASCMRQGVGTITLKDIKDCSSSIR